MLFAPYFCSMESHLEAQNNADMLSFEAFRSSVLADYRVALLSREVSLLGRREVLTGKAKFGIFGDGKEVAQVALAKYLAYKGSITVNGVSLTVNHVQDHLDGGALQNAEISINLIPHTVENTALGSLETGSAVNLEIDTVARYVERMLHVEKLLETKPAV